MLSAFISIFGEIIYLLLTITLIKSGFGCRPLDFLLVIICLAVILVLHEVTVTCCVNDENKRLWTFKKIISNFMLTYNPNFTPEGFENNYINISADQIKTYYNLAPEKYKLHPKYIIYKDGDRERCIIPESKKEWKKYYKWFVDRQIEKDKGIKKEIDIRKINDLSKYLNDVKTDLDACKARANDCFEQAKEIVSEVNENIGDEQKEDAVQSNDDKIVLTMKVD